ncbi:hypothetical protein V2J09_021012 [Rumex salicifolius]
MVRFYLSVYAPYHPPNRVWDYLDSVTSQLLTVLRKGILIQDVQHDKVIEFCVTIAESNLDLLINHLILQLLKQDSPSEAKVIGLRALHKIVASPSGQYNGLEISQGHEICHYIPKTKPLVGPTKDVMRIPVKGSDYKKMMRKKDSYFPEADELNAFLSCLHKY